MRFQKTQKSRFEEHSKDMVELLVAERAAIEKLANPDGNGRKTTLHSHQIQAVLETITFFDNPDRSKIGLIQVPTGGGKSGIISLLPYALGSHKVMVLSPGLVITNQLEKTFGGESTRQSFMFNTIPEVQENITDILPPIKVIRSSKHHIPDMSKHELVIVNAQKFVRLDDESGEIVLNGKEGEIRCNVAEPFDTIIVDEAHHYPATTWMNIIELFSKAKKKIIFLTATPKPNVEGVQLIYEISRDQLIEKGIIRKIIFHNLEVNNPNDVTDDELVRLTQEMMEVLKDQDVAVAAVKHKAMILTKSDTTYTEALSKRLNQLIGGNKAIFCISGAAKNQTIFDRNDDYHRIMVVCKMLTEGYDNPNVSVCAILRNIHSDILFNQFVGRCIRVSKNRGNVEEDVEAHVYGPQAMWNRYEQNAGSDPIDEV